MKSVLPSPISSVAAGAGWRRISPATAPAATEGILPSPRASHDAGGECDWEKEFALLRGFLRETPPAQPFSGKAAAVAATACGSAAPPRGLFRDAPDAALYVGTEQTGIRLNVPDKSVIEPLLHSTCRGRKSPCFSWTRYHTGLLCITPLPPQGTAKAAGVIKNWVFRELELVSIFQTIFPLGSVLFRYGESTSASSSTVFEVLEVSQTTVHPFCLRQAGHT